MKKLILSLFWLLLYLSSFAQPYKPCLDGDYIKWSTIYGTYDLAEQSLEIMAHGDTIINEMLYKKIYMDDYIKFEYEETNGHWKDWIDISGLINREQYCIRESEDASKLYIYEVDSQKEYLILDMNLKVGDTFTVSEIWEYILYYRTMVVDSVYIKDGLKHIRFDLYCAPPGYFGYMTFIEGVGPNIGILPNFHSFPQIINCFQNQSFYYKNEDISLPCGYWGQGGGAIDNLFSDKDYSVYVSKNNIEIYSTVHISVQVSLSDLSGRTYYNQSFAAGKNILISRSSFPAGVYLLKIAAENKSQFQVIKIIL